MLDQSSPEAVRVVSICPLSMGEGRIVFEQPAVEPIHVLEPDLAARGHGPEQLPRQIREPLRLAGAARVNMRVNMSLGSRPTSSANMQNTSRFTKCATSLGPLPLIPERLRKPGEVLRSPFRQCLTGLARP